MLKLIIPKREFFDEETQKFFEIDETTLLLEHSLVSLYEWETRWNKPFLSKVEKTDEESIDYIRCMTLNRDVDPNVYRGLTNENIEEINKYVSDQMTAANFGKRNTGSPNSEPVIAELIYYWMSQLGIDMSWEKRHLNSLVSFIRVCSIKNQPPKKMGRKALMARNTSLNAARRQALNSKG